ncbi:hypothetical protein PQI07_27230 [Methylobacterium sp. 092160098-2]|uniref:hypothetical protein n=1 Tax=Methylobacterium sp. 092160098-2 TaxID=3025129 RepID=UPI002381A19C|nr:hypothetical protein [Methylobacterium sp. 092160098-2]MDE4914368.1 hypothetical protein [Methylobacterium sp. 092160098-2]
MEQEKQYHIVFTSSTIATSVEQAVHIALDQVAEGSAHAEVFDDGNKLVDEPDMLGILAKRPPVRMTPADGLDYEIVLNAARRLAETLTQEQRNLLAGLDTADTPERAQIVRDIARSVFERDAQPDATQSDALVLGNVRYAVGRSTHVVQTAVDLAIARWDTLADATKETILDEVAYAVSNGKAGMEMDEREWRRLVDHGTPATGPRF